MRIPHGLPVISLAMSDRVATNGFRAAELMRLVRPLISQRRRAQIERALAACQPERLSVAPEHCVVAGCTEPHRPAASATATA